MLTYLSIDNAQSNAAALRQGLFAQGTLGTAQSSLLAIPLASVRTDRPAPYVQAIENSKVIYRTIELGSRGNSDGTEVVAVKGLADKAMVIQGNIGALREGTAVKFTPSGMPTAAASSATSAP